MIYFKQVNAPILIEDSGFKLDQVSFRDKVVSVLKQGREAAFPEYTHLLVRTYTCVIEKKEVVIFEHSFFGS